MIARNVEELYERHIKPLPISDRLRLVEIIARGAAESRPSVARRERSILELEGLGAHIWKGVDPQQYVANLRKEWDCRP